MCVKGIWSGICDSFTLFSYRYRFVEMYYHRGERTHKGKAVGPRVETVVLFLPDVWSCVPTRLEWDGLQHNYEKQLARKLSTEQDGGAAGGSSGGGGTAASNGAATASADDQKASYSKPNFLHGKLYFLSLFPFFFKKKIQ